MNDDGYSPLYRGPRLVPVHPHDGMAPDVSALWRYFSEQLGWGTTELHTRLTFDFLINARTFSHGLPVLDAGAGHQRYRPFFDNAVYLSQEHPSGIDFKQMQGLSYDLISPIDERIPLKSASIACIVSTSVLEHVRYPERFLAEAMRVLHPGGRLYIHVPFAYPEHEQPYDFQRPTRYGLSAWLSAAGFSKVNVLPSSNSTHGASHALMKAMQTELVARGLGQRYVDLAPVLKYCIDTVNTATSDYIDAASDVPVGWVAIAEKDGALGEFPQWTKEQWLQSIRD